MAFSGGTIPACARRDPERHPRRFCRRSTCADGSGELLAKAATQAAGRARAVWQDGQVWRTRSQAGQPAADGQVWHAQGWRNGLR